MKKDIVNYLGYKCIDRVSGNEGTISRVCHYSYNQSIELFFVSSSYQFWEDSKRFEFLHPRFIKQSLAKEKKAVENRAKYLGKECIKSITNVSGICTVYVTSLFGKDLIGLERGNKIGVLWIEQSRLKVVKPKQEKKKRKDTIAWAHTVDTPCVKTEKKKPTKKKIKR